ncbi:MAG: hypothetical protein V1874_02535 [Spirochaetota bacterium]
MEFIILIFINIIMGALFYLILRLKLEKHASDYREKRFRREMDEIICAFNETAERNITILEKKIEYLKKIIKTAGLAGSISYDVDDNMLKNDKAIENDNIKILENSGNKAGKSVDIKLNSKLNSNGSIIKGYLQIKGRLFDAYKSIFENRHNVSLDIQSDNTDKIMKGQDTIPVELLAKYDRSMEESKKKCITKDTINNDLEKSEFKLIEMFKHSDDKYILISQLYNEGYPADFLCKCSGIPMGEIKLVLDLHTSL